MKAHIYFLQFLKDDGETIGGGGIGTLISLLCPVLEGLGHEVTVYQCAGREFDVKWGDTRVVGVPGYPGPGRSNEKVVQDLRGLAHRHTGGADAIEIFPGDFFSIKNNNPYAICVQEGLAWDAAIDLITPNKLHHTPLGEKIFRYRCQLRGLRRFETCRNRVAADLFFLNWYRSFRGPNVDGRLFYNPNPAPASAWDSGREQPDTERPLRIIFARRFVPEKGTRIIAQVFQDLLRLRPNISITLAGEGHDRELLEKAFSGDSRVVIEPYRTEEALDVHSRHDIAVIPSLCGEATCLAVLEGMAAGCAVVVTNMGGTITEVIDGYSGMLCWPEKKSILDALLRLIDDGSLRLAMQKRGWEISQTSFHIGIWRSRWESIINEVVNA